MSVRPGALTIVATGNRFAMVEAREGHAQYDRQREQAPGPRRSRLEDVEQTHQQVTTGQAQNEPSHPKRSCQNDDRGQNVKRSEPAAGRFGVDEVKDRGGAEQADRGHPVPLCRRGSQHGGIYHGNTWLTHRRGGSPVGRTSRSALCFRHLAKRESGSFSWDESEPNESTDKDGLPTEVADALPTVRRARSNDNEETHRDIKRPGGVDPFGLTLDDAGATRLELEQTLPPIRAPSARLVAPSLPERPAPRTPPPVQVEKRSNAAETMPTEPELDPPPRTNRRRPARPLTTIILAIVISLLLALAVLLVWHAGDPETIVADPAPHAR